MANRHKSRETRIAEILSKCEKQENGCIEWKGFVDPKRGYGRVGFFGKFLMVHRLIFEHYKGEVPAGMCLDHLCRNRACVNVEHLEVVTNKENVLRGVGITAKNKSKIFCPSGHEYTESNTRVSKTGKRSCRTCDRDRWRKKHGQNIANRIDIP